MRTTGSVVNLSYTYDATGNKLARNSSGTVRNYVNGIEYKPDGTTIDIIHTEEGVAQNNGSGTYTYHYNLSDHLGNVRYTFDVVNGIVSPLQKDDYYAFGKRKTSMLGSADNKYLYNGKELQEELGQYDYGARFYDPIIGRWNVIDAKSELYFQITPYAYAANTPTNAIDPNGHLVIFINGQHGGDGGSAEYWNSKTKSFDSAVQKHFNDWSKPRYYDGAVGGWKNTFYIADMSAKNMQYDNMSANSRWSAGYNQAKKDAEAIILSLARTGGVITESLKIVSHSMGGAYAKGFVKAIIQYAQDHPELTKGLRISEYDFDPFQGGELKAEHGVHTEQYMHNGKKHISWWKFWDTDKIADQKQSGLEMDDNKFVESPTQTQHSIFSFFNNISQLEEGKYVFKNGEWQKSN